MAECASKPTVTIHLSRTHKSLSIGNAVVWLGRRAKAPCHCIWLHALHILATGSLEVILIRPAAPSSNNRSNPRSRRFDDDPPLERRCRLFFFSHTTRQSVWMICTHSQQHRVDLLQFKPEPIFHSLSPPCLARNRNHRGPQSGN